ncbi:hypothetical protein ACLB4W_003639 [Vibrio cholerae]|nr:hypothetical protein [Vibrio cholerae]ELM0317301.1 hypothetical protein [Vibrio cholerae]GIA26081.1 hypothetical protein VCSRO179_3466 [Vibrio cholerae]
MSFIIYGVVGGLLVFPLTRSLKIKIRWKILMSLMLGYVIVYHAIAYFAGCHNMRNQIMFCTNSSTISLDDLKKYGIY